MSGIRWMLITRHERLYEQGHQRLRTGFAAGDCHDEVLYTHTVTEKLRAAHRAGNERADGADIRERDGPLARLPPQRRPRATPPPRTPTRLSRRPNAATTASATFDYRLQLLLPCGDPTWHDPTAACIRGRTHRFAA